MVSREKILNDINVLDQKKGELNKNYLSKSKYMKLLNQSSQM